MEKYKFKTKEETNMKITLKTSSPFWGWNYKITIKKSELEDYFEPGTIKGTYILKNVSPAFNGIFSYDNK